MALVSRGHFPSRERAQEAIAAGMVRVNGRVITKPARKVDPGDAIEVTGDPIGYVGRGGLKLQGALDQFGIDPAGRVCLDVGASTGGFTDCLLRRGARRVYAVDVGRGQLHPSLRADPRVVAMEETDIRRVERLPEAPALAVVDVSFISLTLVLPAVVRLLEGGRRHFVLDLSPVTFVDSMGLGMIVAITKRIRAHAGSLLLACSNDHVRKVFKVGGLYSVYAFYDSVDAATRRVPVGSGLADWPHRRE